MIVSGFWPTYKYASWFDSKTLLLNVSIILLSVSYIHYLSWLMTSRILEIHENDCVIGLNEDCCRQHCDSAYQFGFAVGLRACTQTLHNPLTRATSWQLALLRDKPVNRRVLPDYQRVLTPPVTRFCFYQFRLPHAFFVAALRSLYIYIVWKPKQPESETVTDLWYFI